MQALLHHSPLSRLRALAAEESGVALVEFALVLPLLALMIFGALDLGKAYNYWIDETHLASEGARYAAVGQSPDPSQTNFLAAIREQAEDPELRNGGTSSVPNALQVCVSLPDGNAVGDPVTVTVTSNYHFLSFLASKIDVLQEPVVATSTMRLERVPSFTDGECA
jgi:Flp pilus assembly protein TadG